MREKPDCYIINKEKVIKEGECVTIAEIAKLAGVSSASVSRYLNNGYISEEKKQKIKEVIEKTGYRPSLQAQTLRTKKSKLIGVVLPKINSETISRIVAGISLILSSEGFQILLANTENSVEKELEYLSVFQNNNVEGIIFIATLLRKEHKTIIKQIDVPVVVVGQRVDYTSCIYHNDFLAAKELTEIMLLNDRQHIAYIGVTVKDKAAGLERKKGYLDAMKSYHRVVEEQLMAESDFSMESGYEAMKKLWKECKYIDAVFCATDFIAVGAMKYLKEQQIKIPEQIQIVGIGHTKLSTLIEPTLTTAHFYYKTSGQYAAEMLLGLLKEQKKVIKETKLGFEIVEQQSTKNKSK